MRNRSNENWCNWRQLLVNFQTLTIAEWDGHCVKALWEFLLRHTKIHSVRATSKQFDDRANWWDMFWKRDWTFPPMISKGKAIDRPVLLRLFWAEREVQSAYILGSIPTKINLHTWPGHQRSPGKMQRPGRGVRCQGLRTAPLTWTHIYFKHCTLKLHAYWLRPSHRVQAPAGFQNPQGQFSVSF